MKLMVEINCLDKLFSHNRCLYTPYFLRPMYYFMATIAYVLQKVYKKAKIYPILSLYAQRMGQ